MSIQKYVLALATCLAALSASVKADGQIVTTTDYAKQANVKVFVTQYKLDADVVVFKTPFLQNSMGNRGVWYFTKSAGEANKKVFYIKHKEEADVVVYFTNKSSEAGWINKKKRYLFN